MAQQNHNASYIFDVDGLTVWEKLRNIRVFLHERAKARDLAYLQVEKFDAKIQELEPGSIEYREAMISQSDIADLLQDCIDEIAFLETYEKQLAAEAEKTRVPGKSDREMYEMNYYAEHTARTILDAQSQLMSTGSISPETVKTILKNPITLDYAVALGLLPKETQDVPVVAISRHAGLLPQQLPASIQLLLGAQHNG